MKLMLHMVNLSPTSLLQAMTSGISLQEKSEMQNPVMMLSVHGTTHQYSDIGYPWILSRISILGFLRRCCFNGLRCR